MRDTDCCQRLGGAGEEAAIDSFINPSAGVLLLKYHDTLLSQSYFHYVDGGYILDNVEFNEKNCKRMGWKIQNDQSIELSKLYADFAQNVLKRQPSLKFFKCGLAFNKLSATFQSATMENDPREFLVEDPYTDFDKNNHLDLLKPTDALKTITVSVPKSN